MATQYHRSTTQEHGVPPTASAAYAELLADLSVNEASVLRATRPALDRAAQPARTQLDDGTLHRTMFIAL
jgi:hypothetical protein